MRIPMDVQARVMQAIQTEQGKWIKRSALAQRLGQQRLNATDLLVLYILETNGLIEVRTAPADRGVGFRWEYRIIPPQN